MSDARHTSGGGADQESAGPARLRPFLLVPIGAVGAGLVLLGTSVMSLAVVAPERITNAVTPKFAQTAERMTRADRGRHLRLPVDPSITARQVAQAVLDAEDMTWEFDGPSAESLGASPLVSEGGSPFRGPNRLTLDAIIPAAARGLDDAERAYLEAFVADERIAALDRIARGGEFDGLMLGEMQFGMEVLSSDDFTPFDVPIPSLAHVREYAYLKVVEAGIHLDDGDPARAEESLREAVSLGFLLRDRGSTLIAALVGAVTAEIGLDHLEQLFRETDQTDRVAALSNTDDGEGGDASNIPSTDLARQWDFIFDAAQPRQLRSELLGSALVRESCGSVRGILFGMSDELREKVETGTLRSELVRTENEARVWDATLDWQRRVMDRHAAAGTPFIDLDGRETVSALGRGVAEWFGQDRIAACWTLFEML